MSHKTILDLFNEVNKIDGGAAMSKEELAKRIADQRIAPKRTRLTDARMMQELIIGRRK